MSVGPTIVAGELGHGKSNHIGYDRWKCPACHFEPEDFRANPVTGIFIGYARKCYDHDVAVSRLRDPSYVPPYGPPA